MSTRTRLAGRASPLPPRTRDYGRMYLEGAPHGLSSDEQAHYDEMQKYFRIETPRDRELFVAGYFARKEKRGICDIKKGEAWCMGWQSRMDWEDSVSEGRRA